MSEAWRTIGRGPRAVYQVSDQGRVRNVCDPTFPVYLTPDLGNRGHLRVRLYLHEGRRTVLVHHLVAEAFLAPPEREGLLLLHRDDDKTNNTPGNLYWGTREQNARDARANGCTPRGERVGTSKLTAARVRFARLLKRHGARCREVGQLFGVSKAAMSAAIAGRTWGHV